MPLLLIILIVAIGLVLMIAIPVVFILLLTGVSFAVSLWPSMHITGKSDSYSKTGKLFLVVFFESLVLLLLFPTGGDKNAFWTVWIFFGVAAAVFINFAIFVYYLIFK